MKRWLLSAAAALLLAGCAETAPEDATIIIPAGASVARAGTILEEAGVISSSAFRTQIRLFGGDAPIKPGEYAIKAGMSAGDIVKMMQDGNIVLRLVTVPEGMPSIMVYDRLMANDELSGKIDVPAEGSVLPDSYAYSKGEARSAVLMRMQAAMDREFDKLWATRTAASAVKNRNEALALASIVEKETSVPAERRTVAGVYTNRLGIGMRLQADPTIIYPITQGKPLGRRILKSEIQAVNGYNTYSMAGLPKGPIANPGRASIAAVLDPQDHEYLYFVAQGDGSHIFARTLSEHNRNVQKWYALRRERGEM